MREYYHQIHREPLAATQDPPIFLSPEQIVPQNARGSARQEQNTIIRLSKSIEKYGILEPLAVKPTSKSSGFPLYELIDGERRYRAAAIAGVSKLPCVILPQSAPQCLQMAQIQRLLEEKPHYFALAEAFLELINGYHMTQDEIARRMGLSQSAVANKIRLLKLTPDERRIIASYGLSERHARAFLRLSDEDLRTEIIAKTGREALTVARTEEIISEYLSKEKKAAQKPEKQTKTGENEGFLPAPVVEETERTDSSLQTPLVRSTATSAPSAAPLAPPNALPASKDGVIPRKFALRDLKPLYNSIERTLGIFQKTGVAAEYRKEEDENAARIVIYIPKRG